jgi:hypothetical protein
MSFSPSKMMDWVKCLLAAIALSLLAGCIADTAEDSDLPWARNQGWEGMIPLPAGIADRYD